MRKGSVDVMSRGIQAVYISIEDPKHHDVKMKLFLALLWHFSFVVWFLLCKFTKNRKILAFFGLWVGGWLFAKITPNGAIALKGTGQSMD